VMNLVVDEVQYYHRTRHRPLSESRIDFGKAPFGNVRPLL
jgi:hypothetical protein